MNLQMWVKALKIIPKIEKSEWDRLDIISRWLIACRAAVLVLTFVSAAIAGLLAIKDGLFHPGAWVLVMIGLLFAHAANNLLNDLTDFDRGVDRGNYFRTQYGPQPLEQGLLTRQQVLTYAAFNLVIALLCGILLFWMRGWLILALTAAGAVFLFFYTYPLKYIGLGEITVVIVWGPLMIGGGYYAITGVWDWMVVLASLPYALGATTVIFGKHIDKLAEDKAKGIHTLPVILGEAAARRAAQGLMVLMYALIALLVATGYFSPVLLLVFLAIFFARRPWQMYNQPRPAAPPADLETGIWPMWFVAAAFYHNRAYGLLLVFSMLLAVVLKPIIGF